MHRWSKLILALTLILSASSATYGQNCDLRSKLETALNAPFPDAQGPLVLNSPEIRVEPVRVGLSNRGIPEHSNSVSLVRVGRRGTRLIFKSSEGEAERLLTRFTPGRQGSLAAREVIASEADRMLGLGRVPESRPAILNGKPGVAIEFVEGESWGEVFMNLVHAKAVERGNLDFARALEEQIVFDFLLGNGDRRWVGSALLAPDYTVNGGNWIFKTDSNYWVTDVKFIDNGLALNSRYGTNEVLGAHEVETYLKGQISELAELLPEELDHSALIERISAVTAGDWRAMLAPYVKDGFVTEADVNGLLTRRRYLIDRYAKEKGPAP